MLNLISFPIVFLILILYCFFFALFNYIYMLIFLDLFVVALLLLFLIFTIILQNLILQNFSLVTLGIGASETGIGLLLVIILYKLQIFLIYFYPHSLMVKQ